MTLAKTAILSHKAPAELAGIIDPCIAAAFNVECADVLFEFEQKRQNELYEALGLGAVTNALGGGASHARPSGPVILDA